MFPLDKIVWTNFVAKYGGQYLNFQYDVTCGLQLEVDPTWNASTVKDAQILSKLRIDAVGETPGFIDIIEVKPRGNMSAIGQLLTYETHYIKEYHPIKPTRKILVCQEIDANIAEICDANKIIYMIV
jgi:hypothetical protein